MAEMTQVSEQPADAEEPRDRVPELVALGLFLAVMALCVGLVLIEFQIPEVVRKVAPWVILIAIVLQIRFGVQSSHLPPKRRAQRDERRAGAVVGVLSGCTVLAAITAASYLTSWADWVVLGAFVVGTFGVGLMLHVRFTIGA
jgi:hypothetical protein